MEYIWDAEDKISIFGNKYLTSKLSKDIDYTLRAHSVRHFGVDNQTVRG